MSDIFCKVLELSIYGSVLILLVAVLRLIFRRIPHSIICLLWGIVALRLICPIKIETGFSLIPEIDIGKYMVAESGVVSTAYDIDIISENSFDIDSFLEINSSNTGVSNDTYPDASSQVNDLFFDVDTVGNGASDFSSVDDKEVSSQQFSENESSPQGEIAKDHNTYQLRPFKAASDITLFGKFIGIFSLIWIFGSLFLVFYVAFKYIKLHKAVAERIPVQDGVYICDRIPSPFIMGIVKPNIYIPSSLPEEIYTYAIAHEKAHIKRFDSIWKLVAVLLLCIYWFNPFCWLAFYLFSKDTELACDELVIKDMSAKEKQEYSSAMLMASVPKSRMSLTLSFGEISVKERIEAILDYKKPSLWIILASILVVALILLFALTSGSRKAEITSDSEETSETTSSVNETQEDNAQVDSETTAATDETTAFVGSSELISDPAHLLSNKVCYLGEDVLTTFYWQHKDSYLASSKRIAGFKNANEEVAIFYDGDNFDGSDKINRIVVNGKTIDYVIEDYEAYNSVCSVYKGFYYDGEYYDLLYKDDVISGVAKDGEDIAAYVYAKFSDGAFYGTVLMGVYEKDETGSWSLTKAADFIGNMNKIRGAGYLYEDATGWCLYAPTDKWVQIDLLENGEYKFASGSEERLPADYVNPIGTGGSGYFSKFVGYPYFSKEYFDKQYEDFYSELEHSLSGKEYLKASVTVDESKFSYWSESPYYQEGDKDFITDLGLEYSFDGENLHVYIKPDEDVEIVYNGKSYYIRNKFMYMSYPGLDQLEVFLCDVSGDQQRDLIITARNQILSIFDLENGKLMDFELSDEIKAGMKTQLAAYAGLSNIDDFSSCRVMCADNAIIYYMPYKDCYVLAFVFYYEGEQIVNYEIRKPITYTYSTYPFDYKELATVFENGEPCELSYVPIANLLKNSDTAYIVMPDWMLSISWFDNGYAFGKCSEEDIYLGKTQLLTELNLPKSLTSISNPIDIDNDGELEIVVQYAVGARGNVHNIIIDKVGDEILFTEFPEWPEFSAVAYPDYQIEYEVKGMTEAVNEASGYKDGRVLINGKGGYEGVIGEIWDENGKLTGEWAYETESDNGELVSAAINTWASESNEMKLHKAENGYVLSRECYPAFISGAGGIVTYREYYKYADGQFDIIRWEMELYSFLQDFFHLS